MYGKSVVIETVSTVLAHNLNVRWKLNSFKLLSTIGIEKHWFNSISVVVGQSNTFDQLFEFVHIYFYSGKLNEQCVQRMCIAQVK